GLAARAHRSDARPADRADADDADGGGALRPLPGLHGVRDRMSVGGPVRRADRGDARVRGAEVPAGVLGSAAPLDDLPGLSLSPPVAGDGGVPAGVRLDGDAMAGPPQWGAEARSLPHASAGGAATCRGFADRLLAAAGAGAGGGGEADEGRA